MTRAREYDGRLRPSMVQFLPAPLDSGYQLSEVFHVGYQISTEVDPSN